MPFDRAAAKAAGYSDAEIDDYLHSVAPDTAAAAPSGGGGGINPALAAALGVGAGGAAVGGGIAAVKAARGAPDLAKRAVKMAARRIPGVGEAMDVKELLTGGKAKLPPSLVELSPSDVKHAALKNFKPGQVIRRVTYEKALMESPKKVPTRPISIVEGGKKTPARAPAQTTEPPYSGGRGKSNPQLAREAAFREAMPELPPSSAAPEASDLETQLQRALIAEQAMGKAGIPIGPSGAGELSAVRTGYRNALGRIAPGALGVLLGLLDIQSLPGQMQEAQQFDPRFQGPQGEALRRALQTVNQFGPTRL